MTTRDTHPVRVIAHRGLPRVAPENSAAALVAARDAGAEIVELDARRTRDGLFVVLHDRSAKRMTGTRVRADETDARTLIDLPFLASPAERLLLLDEALALLAGRVTLDVEVKLAPGDVPDEVAAALLETLARAGSPRRLVVTSSSDVLLRALRGRAPLLDTGLVFRSRDVRDAVRTAREAGARFLVANALRCRGALPADAAAAGLELWAYTVNDVRAARALVERGCRGIVTDDWPALAAAFESGGDETGDASGGPALLVLDLGSSSTRGLVVDPGAGVVARAARPARVDRGEPGRFEHDPSRTLEDARAVIEELARTHDGPPPVAAAVASQRSTGLWAARETLSPLSPAVSWRDTRGAAVVRSLEGERARLEAIAGLPLDAAWTAVAGTATRPADAPGGGVTLLPLGSWIVARLTGERPRVDPTLANRTFLIDRSTFDWSDELLAAFSLSREELPVLAPSVAAHGALQWAGNATVPLRAVIGDQQAAYIGAAGPLGRRLVVNLGTGSFVMRAGTFEERVPGGARVAPLWSSAKRPRPDAALIELVVHGDTPPGIAGADEVARHTARQLAFGDDAPRRHAEEVASAAASLATIRDRVVLVAGGALASPHLLALLLDSLSLEPVVALERELTAVGAARLAAAASGIAWRLPAAGGVTAPDAGGGSGL